MAAEGSLSRFQMPGLIWEPQPRSLAARFEQLADLFPVGLEGAIAMPEKVSVIHSAVQEFGKTLAVATSLAPGDLKVLKSRPSRVQKFQALTTEVADLLRRVLDATAAHRELSVVRRVELMKHLATVAKLEDTCKPQPQSHSPATSPGSGGSSATATSPSAAAPANANDCKSAPASADAASSPTATAGESKSNRFVVHTPVFDPDGGWKAIVAAAKKQGKWMATYQAPGFVGVDIDATERKRHDELQATTRHLLDNLVRINEAICEQIKQIAADKKTISEQAFWWRLGGFLLGVTGILIALAIPPLLPALLPCSVATIAGGLTVAVAIGVFAKGQSLANQAARLKELAEGHVGASTVCSQATHSLKSIASAIDAMHSTMKVVSASAGDFKLSILVVENLGLLRSALEENASITYQLMALHDELSQQLHALEALSTSLR